MVSKPLELIHQTNKMAPDPISGLVLVSDGWKTDRPFRTGKEPGGCDAPLKPLSDKTDDGTSPCRISTFRIFSGFNTPEEIGRHLYIPIEALFCAELDKVSGCRVKN